MSVKKMGEDNIVNKNIDEVLSSIPAQSLDSDLENDKASFDMDKDEANPMMTLHPSSVSEGRGMTAAIQIETKPGRGFKDDRDISSPVPKGNGVSRKQTSNIDPNKTKFLIPSDGVRPATEVDIENLDESHIANMPEIKAATFEIIDMLNLKPKDKTIRFRWANFKNYVAGNLSRYFSLGYSIASIDDVDIQRTPVDPSMIEGTQVKYYDIVLIKIPVIRLMELYKANIVKAANRLIKSRERGIREAQRAFVNEVQQSGKLQGGYNKMREQMQGEEPVVFYTPGVEEFVSKS
jgi:hypothetical protein